MLDAFKETICQIAIFMICAQAIVHFRPKEAYGKYLRMLLSVMILVQIFQPFSSLLFGVSGQQLSLGMAAFQEALEKSLDRASEQSALAQEKLENMSLQEVQERLAEQEQLTEPEQPEEEADISAVEPIEIKVEISEE